MLPSTFWQKLITAELPPQKSRALLEALGSSAYDPCDFLDRSGYLSDAERKRIESFCPSIWERAEASGVLLLHRDRYPEFLKDTPGVAPALCAWGDPKVMESPTVAIVGTRAASAYGRACAMKFAEAFAEAGVTVVSGGALGIDGAAHSGALKAGGKTIAVLGGGVDNVYPSVHRALFQQIREAGCLVSQFPVGTKPNGHKFLIRNGLIAALSLGVLVVEAPSKSGAISTATAAAELGRQVFVVPANIDAVTFRGSFSLIRDGATLVTHPSQVLQALSLDFELLPPLKKEGASASGSLILQALTSSPVTAEVISERTGLSTSELLSELTILELEGLVIRDATGYALTP